MSISRAAIPVGIYARKKDVSITSILINQPGHGFVVGDSLCSNGVDGQYKKTSALTVSDSRFLGICTEVVDVDNFRITTHGYVTAGVPTGTPGSPIYLSKVDGDLTVTEYTANNDINKQIAILTSSGTQMLIQVSPHVAISISTSFEFSDGGNVTFTDGSDFIFSDG